MIAPRIGRRRIDLVARHRDAGELVVLTTATNRFLTELTAAHLGLPHLIATECEVDADGRFTGRIAGTLNMREGKVARLHEWLATQRIDSRDCEATFYSDSINDLPLLRARAQAGGGEPRHAAGRRGRRARLAGAQPARPGQLSGAHGSPPTAAGSALAGGMG